MLPEISNIKIITLTNITSITSIITTKKPIKYHSNTIKISIIKKTHLVIVYSSTFKTTNIITHPITHEIKKSLKITNFLTIKNNPTEIKVNYETKIIKSLTLKTLS